MTEKIILILGSICICVFTTIAYSQADYVFENASKIWASTNSFTRWWNNKNW